MMKGVWGNRDMEIGAALLLPRYPSIFFAPFDL